MPRAQNENLKPIYNAVLVLMSLYVAFSIGANNVANAAGPIASMTANELNIVGDDNFVVLNEVPTRRRRDKELAPLYRESRIGSKLRLAAVLE